MTSELEHAAGPAWVAPALEAAARWLWTGFDTETTRTAYANHLGIPREMQGWRGQPRHRNARRDPDPVAFFPWCARAGVDPHTGPDRDTLRTWIADMDAAGLAKSTQRSRLGAVAAWYGEQRAGGHSHIVLADLLPKPERARLGVDRTDPRTTTVPLTLPQVRALRAAAELDPGRMRLRNRAMVAVLSMTGIRADELCQLDRDTIYRTGPDGAGPALWIDGKGARRRWVRLPGPALALLDEYLAARDAETTSVPAHRGQVSAGRSPVFVTISGHRLEPQHVTDALRQLCRSLARVAARSTSSTVRTHAAALRPIATTIHPHQARHTYAVALDEHGVSVRQIRIDLGHASLSTTQRYLDAGRHLSGSGAPALADLITAGEHLTLLPDQADKHGTVGSTQDSTHNTGTHDGTGEQHAE